jgi:hypothetical protein
MSIEITPNDRRDEYTATSGQTVFSYTFPIYAEDQVAVYQNSTLLTITSEYTVSGVGDQNGGSITLVTGASDGDVIVIDGEAEIERLTQYVTSGDFTADVVNEDLNQIVIFCQELDTKIGRAIVLDDSDTTSTLVLETASERAGNVLGFDDNGDLEYFDSEALSDITGYVEQAETSATEAAASATAAATSATEAATSATEAEASASLFPTITTGTAGDAVVVNSTEDAYELLDIGTAATYDAGTTAGDLPILNSDAELNADQLYLAPVRNYDGNTAIGGSYNLINGTWSDIEVPCAVTNKTTSDYNVIFAVISCTLTGSTDRTVNFRIIRDTDSFVVAAIPIKMTIDYPDSVMMMGFVKDSASISEISYTVQATISESNAESLTVTDDSKIFMLDLNSSAGSLV